LLQTRVVAFRARIEDRGVQCKPFPTGTICPAPPADFGLTTTSVLLAEGLTYSAISRRVARGALVRRHRGVYSFGPGALSDDAEWAAAVFAAGEGAVLNHLSAARLWRASRWAAPIAHVLVPGHRRPLEGVILHSYRHLDPLDVVIYRGIPVTTVARMLVDLSDVLTAHQLAYVMHEAAFHKRFSVSATRAAMARANGRRGLAVLAKALELHLSGSAGTRSGLEDAFLALVAELPEPLVNTACEGEEVDFRWPDRDVIVEVDGRGHRRRGQRSSDARRDAKLTAAGYTVLRFTDVEIEQTPDVALERLRASLATGQPGR
jgi:hypothetical protein